MNIKKSKIDHKSSPYSIEMETFTTNNDRTRLLDEENEMSYGRMESKCLMFDF